MLVLSLFCVTVVSTLIYLYFYYKGQKSNREELGGKEIKDLLMKHPLRHLGVIMDGNRRWAKQRGYQPWIGHTHGLYSVERTIKFCLDYQISYLTLYVFSLENFKRTEEELKYLFEVVTKITPDRIQKEGKHLQSLYDQGVRVQFLGDRSQFPTNLVNDIQNIEIKTKDKKTLIVSLLFCYGGQQEIIAAVQNMYEDLNKNNKIKEHGNDKIAITKELFEKYLWTGDLPKLDLMIRTGSVQRLSNFLLYHSAYSEFYFSPCLWPDWNEKHLLDALRYYISVKRNFGS